jgi:hypothetical protein
VPRSIPIAGPSPLAISSSSANEKDWLYSFLRSLLPSIPRRSCCWLQRDWFVETFFFSDGRRDVGHGRSRGGFIEEMAGLEGSDPGDLGRWIGVLECSGGCWFWWRASMEPGSLLRWAPYARLLDRPSLVASTLCTSCQSHGRCWPLFP